LFDKETLILNHSYALSASDSITFQVCKFYLTALDSSGHSSYFLLDAEDEKSLLLNFPSVPKQLYLGVDVQMNQNPVFKGALDPIYGMYWTWQSGFIHLKIEASISRKGSPKQKLEYHIGGFENATNTCLPMPETVLSNGKNECIVSLSDFVRHLDFSKTSIMSPQPAAVHIAQLFTNCIK
jgi:hypothetical protein